MNPRLQVEHPVTEMITNVNLPAAQLQVAMGIPLDNIPEIRTLYGRNRFADDPSSEDARIDFMTAERRPANGHCIAVRITAENAEAGFKPTSGGIQEINFRSTPSVWGYFSMDSSGSIHEFADSQFGHLFANGVDREQARRNMVLALKELSIRGDISTTVDYISRLIELPDFIDNNIDTAWLDGIISENVEGIATLVEDNLDPKTTNRSTLKRSALSASDLTQEVSQLYIVLGATIVAYDKCSEDEGTFLELMSKGQLPPRNLLKMSHPIELILNGVKYILICTRGGQNSFKIELNRSFVMTNVRKLSDGGYLIEVGGQSHVAYLTSKGDDATGMKMNVAGYNTVFSPDYDPTSLRTDVAGKLVKRLVPDGTRVKKGEAYAEIEVMKMFMPLKVEEAGVVEWKANEGAALSPGDLLATLKLDNPENVASTTVFVGNLSVEGSGALRRPANAKLPHLVLRAAIDELNGAMTGFALGEDEVDAAMEDLALAVTDSLLPMLEVDEQLSVLSGRIPAKLFDSISSLNRDFQQSSEGDSRHQRFPASQVLSLLDEYSSSLNDTSSTGAFVSLTQQLKNAAVPYTLSKVDGVQGAERLLQCFIDILRRWISVERWFCDEPSYADSVENIRKLHKEDAITVFNICRSHEQIKTTSYIITRIMDAINDASRVDLATAEEAPNAKRISIVAGAQSLLDAFPAISEVGMMGQRSEYAEVALRARKLLMQESMPNLEERKQRVRHAAQKLSDSDSKEADDLLTEQTPLMDVFFPLLKEIDARKEEVGLLELYARHLYHNHTIKETEKKIDQRLVKFSFFNKTSEKVLHKMTSVASMASLSSAMSSSNLSILSDSTEGDKESKVTVKKIASNIERTGICKIVDSIDEIDDASFFEGITKNFPQFSSDNAGPINVLYIIVAKTDVENDEKSCDLMSGICQTKLAPYKELLEKAQIRRVTVSFDREDSHNIAGSPPTFTYRSPLFEEESLIRSIDPSHAINLDLGRVASNFSVKTVGARHTSTSHVHMYEATPRNSALAKDKKANKNARIFVRALSFSLDFSPNSFERILVDALNSLDLCSENRRVDNHLFINLLSDFEKVVVDPVVVEQVLVDILKRHGERVSNLGIVEVETKILCSLSLDSLPISLRLVASNPTGYVHVLNTYVEASDENGGDRVFKLIGGTKASLAGAGDSSWEGLNIDTPYPLTRPFDHQRRAALRSSDTLYAYDLPALFEAAVEEEWTKASKGGGIQGSDRPLMIMYTIELVVKNTNPSSPPDDWTMEDYLNGDLELVQVNRGAGANDVGMIAWLMELKTVEYPNGRPVLLIANDITHKAGSFGTREDVVFKLASEFAREKRIPRLYVAANSGARIGLSESVRTKFKVAFKETSKPENGFDFIYVTDEDYKALTATDRPLIKAEPLTYLGENVHRVTDIIGSEPDLGVENLKGSGLIAGETSSAYNDIFTMTIVLGRTVGIGAYLVRLGQRTIQKTTSSPIILTGYQALNKLMGVDVYSTNDQLGGPGIMYSNGVSHLAETDHLRTVQAAINWLSYVPSHRRGLLPIMDIRGVDEIERSIAYSPVRGIPYDPRALLTGTEDDNGMWQSGFFDKGSFKETLAGWAKTVVVGRARLGGIPMGVVITENRTAENIKPADPADVKASEAITQEAGCVWFPNSAYKTAQAINDFRTEDLPLIVFANWRGFSGGQRDMFDEVLKYGSLIVDAFVAYEQPVFVFIPPFAEIRGGAWVVLDASINASVMEMYASESARGGVLEANGLASVKYRTKDLLKTMHRLDKTLIDLDKQLAEADESKKIGIQELIKSREFALLPVYQQISVQFCELHDTPVRMEAVGVIRQQVEWTSARSFFYWRLRRKLAEFDLRKKIIEASEVGRGVGSPTPLEATDMIKQWFMQSDGMDASKWEDDKLMLAWMGNNHALLESKVIDFTQECVSQEVMKVMIAGGGTAKIGTKGIVEGISRAMMTMTEEEKETFKAMLANTLQL